MSWRKGNRPPSVTEDSADESVSEIYGDIKQHLAAPFVSKFFQVFAAYPRFLPIQWRALRPVTETREFFQCAERLRADAYTRAHNYFNIADLSVRLKELEFSEGACRELADTLELFAYLEPLLLLLSQVQQQAFDGGTGSGKASMGSPDPVEPKPTPILIDVQTAPPDIRHVLEQAKTSSGLPVFDDSLRALARWPDFFLESWKLMEPLLASPLYQQCQRGLQDTAWNIGRERPGTVELSVDQLTEAGLDEDDIGSVVRLTQAFTRGYSATLLDISIVKIAFEGGNHLREDHQLLPQGVENSEHAA